MLPSGQQKVEVALSVLNAKSSDLERYSFLLALQKSEPEVFVRMALDHLEKIMPSFFP